MDRSASRSAQHPRPLSVRPPESNEASGRTSRTLDYGLSKAISNACNPSPTHAAHYAVVPMRETEQRVVRNDFAFRQCRRHDPGGVA